MFESDYVDVAIPLQVSKPHLFLVSNEGDDTVLPPQGHWWVTGAGVHRSAQKSTARALCVVTVHGERRHFRTLGSIVDMLFPVPGWNRTLRMYLMEQPTGRICDVHGGLSCTGHCALSTPAPGFVPG